MKKSGDMSLGACSSSASGKRKAKPAEEVPEAKQPSLTLAACTTSKESSVPMPMHVDKIEWEHSFWSESSDDEDDRSSDAARDDEEEQEDYKKFEEFVSEQGLTIAHCYEEQLQDLWFHYRFRRHFIISDEKHEKFKLQNKRRVDFTITLNSRPEITKDSCENEIFEVLEREGLVNMPKNFAIPLIQEAIERKVDLHGLQVSFDLIKKLVTLVPCVQVNNTTIKVTEFLHKTGLAGDLPEIYIDRAIFGFRDALYNLELSGWFHPIIRKDRTVEIFAQIERTCKIRRRKLIQRWKSETPLAYADYIKQKEEEIQSSQMYQDALRDVELHQEFHRHVRSCEFIEHNMKVEELLEDKKVVETRFERLDKSLLIASLKARLSLLHAEHEYTTFESWVSGIARERVEKGRSSMDIILDEIRIKHPKFPQLSDNWIFTDVQHLPANWTEDQKEEEISLFYELLHEVRKRTNCKVSDAYLIEGILDYSKYRSWMEKCPEEFKNEKDKSLYCTSYLISCRRKEWDEAFYDHPVYRIIYENESTLIW